MRCGIFSAVLFLTAVLGAAPVTFSRGGVAGGFIGLRGNWSALPDLVEISQLPGALRFTFHTGVPKEACRIVRAPADSPALLGGESIEIQLVPDPASGVYYHIGFTPEGTVYSARKRDVSWEPEGLRLDVKDWRKVTVDIPFAALGAAAPPRGAHWLVNFCRTRAAGGVTEHASWGGGADFHDVSRYGVLKFDTPDSVQVVPGVQTALDARVRLFGGQSCTVELLEDGRPWPGETNRSGEWHFTAPAGSVLPLKSTRTRLIRVKDGTGRSVWGRAALNGFDNRRFLELDRFVYVPADKVIKWRSALTGEKQFFLAGPRSAKWRSAASSGEEPLPLLPGRYVLTVSNRQARISRVICVVASAPKLRSCETKWERQGEFFRCGGRRRFLLGTAQSRVFALHHGPAFDLANAPEGLLPGALELYAMKGKKLRRSPEGTGYVFPGDEAEVLRRAAAFAAGLKEKPLRISRIAYEAQMKFWLGRKEGLELRDPAEMYGKIYRELKKQAPGQLFSLQIDSQPQAERFAPCCDVFEIAVAGSYLADPFPGIAKALREARRQVPGKPLIQWLGVTVPDNRSRSAEELRAELFLSFLNGSAGAILHLGHGFLPAARSRIWSVISTAGVELDELMEEFHAHPAVKIAEVPGFQAALRDCGAYHLLVAVNCENRDARMKLQLPGGRLFSASFTACEARVFRLKK